MGFLLAHNNNSNEELTNSSTYILNSIDGDSFLNDQLKIFNAVN
jgi:hypothetical protein